VQAIRDYFFFFAAFFAGAFFFAFAVLAFMWIVLLLSPRCPQADVPTHLAGITLFGRIQECVQTDFSGDHYRSCR
jgi:hypothetical protein